MTRYFTVYEVRAGYLTEYFTSESAAEAAAGTWRDAEISTISVPLPDVTVAIHKGMVVAVTTTDGISVPALVKDYDVDGIDPDRITTDDNGDASFEYDVD